MKTMIVSLAALLLTTTLGVAQQPAAPKVKALRTPEDPRQKTILVGRTEVSGMIIQFELEPAKSMWMSFRNPSRVEEHAAQPDERYHVEVKPTDPASKTRIPFTRVSFGAVNRTTGKDVLFLLASDVGIERPALRIEQRFVGRWRLRGDRDRRDARVCPGRQQQEYLASADRCRFPLQASRRCLGRDFGA